MGKALLGGILVAGAVGFVHDAGKIFSNAQKVADHPPVLTPEQKEINASLDRFMERVDAIGQGEAVSPAATRKERQVARLFQESEAENNPVVFDFDGHRVPASCVPAGPANQYCTFVHPSDFPSAQGLALWNEQVRRVRYANAEEAWNEANRPAPAAPSSSADVPPVRDLSR